MSNSKLKQHGSDRSYPGYGCAWHAIKMAQVAFCPHAERILISAQSNPVVGQIHGRVDAAVNVLLHLRLAEQAPWKNRHGMDRHFSVDGDQIGRQQQFSSIEFKILQEALVPPLLRVELDILHIESRVLNTIFQHLFAWSRVRPRQNPCDVCLPSAESFSRTIPPGRMRSSND
jgi:hypothetical protein